MGGYLILFHYFIESCKPTQDQTLVLMERFGDIINDLNIDTAHLHRVYHDRAWTEILKTRFPPGVIAHVKGVMLTAFCVRRPFIDPQTFAQSWTNSSYKVSLWSYKSNSCYQITPGDGPMP